MVKKLIILRGLPGSGKSRFAQEYDNRVVCSADNFFVDEDGKYMFDPFKLGEAHAACQVKALRAMSQSSPVVIIDNTNTQKWEYALYQAMAEAFGYEVEVKTIGGRSYEDVREYSQRNVHGVPELKILEMAYRWEE